MFAILFEVLWRQIQVRQQQAMIWGLKVMKITHTDSSLPNERGSPSELWNQLPPDCCWILQMQIQTCYKIYRVSVRMLVGMIISFRAWSTTSRNNTLQFELSSLLFSFFLQLRGNLARVERKQKGSFVKGGLANVPSFWLWGSSKTPSLQKKYLRKKFFRESANCALVIVL